MITKSISDPMIPQRHRVQRILRETLDTFTLELTPVSDNTGFSFAAGQFNMLYIFGVGEVPISISGSPERPEMLVHTVRALGTVTKAMRRLQKGDMVGVRGPFGSHWPVVEAEGKDVLIVAGGIGLAPLRPVLYYLLSHRERYSRIHSFTVHGRQRICFTHRNSNAGEGDLTWKFTLPSISPKAVGSAM